MLLAPGEGLFVGTGVLHTYLGGVGLEVMGASDNVMRGGLTPKHVDVDELVKVLSPDTVEPHVLRPAVSGWYPIPTDTFAVCGLAGAERWTADGPEIVVRLSGAGDTQAWYAAPGSTVDWPGGLGCRVTCPA